MITDYEYVAKLRVIAAHYKFGRLAEQEEARLVRELIPEEYLELTRQLSYLERARLMHGCQWSVAQLKQIEVDAAMLISKMKPLPTSE